MYIGQRVQITQGSFDSYTGTITGEAGSRRWIVRLSHSGGYKIFSESQLITL